MHFFQKVDLFKYLTCSVVILLTSSSCAYKAEPDTSTTIDPAVVHLIIEQIIKNSTIESAK